MDQDQRIRLSATAGLCGLLLLIPVIFLDYVVTPSAFANSNPVLYGFVFCLYALFGLAVILFLFGFASLAREHSDATVQLTAYLLIAAYLTNLIVGIAVVYSAVDVTFGTFAFAEASLIWARAILYFLLGVAILYSRKIEDSMKSWVGICAMLVGIAALSQLVHGSLDDFAIIPFLITGTIMLLRV